MKCVILCAGEGKRLGSDKPKALQTVKGKTILKHIAECWEDCVDGFIVVISPSRTDDFQPHLDSLSTLPVMGVIQEEPKGIADAILSVEPWVDDKFVVALGDCMFRGIFRIPEDEKDGDMTLGVGVWLQGQAADISAGYGVKMANQEALALVEKPTSTADLRCGMGVYFLSSPVFDIIREAQPTPLRNEVEITNVMQACITSGMKVYAVPLDGQYYNINTPDDLVRVRNAWPK